MTVTIVYIYNGYVYIENIKNKQQFKIDNNNKTNYYTTFYFNMRVNVINDIKALAIVSTKNNKGYIIKLNQETKIILEMKDINKVNHFIL